ncbi:MAG: hypothetical protein ICV68_18205, partial [Pyrinomonadaceae bacterium]|nr:hypothetical protein [Pyrinomonadaceae bacterium]
MDEESGDAEYWIAGFSQKRFPESYSVKYFQHSYHDTLLSSWRNGETFLVYTLAGEEKILYDEVLFTQTGYKNIPKQEQELMRGMDSVTFSIAFMKPGALHWGPTPVTEEQANILQRFAKVFEQAYTRFLDLQRAEAQAREAQIEAAVERVRAKALAMHRSEEIMTVVQTLRNELGHLQIEGVFAASIHLQQEGGTIRLWDITITDVLENAPSSSWDLNLRLEEMHPRLYVKRIWDRTEKYFVLKQDEDDFPILVEWVRQFSQKDADEIERAIKEHNIQCTWTAATRLDYGRMHIDLLVPPSAEVESILLKMGAAFDLTYKRFLDLQQAEAQAREAQIEAALERIRAAAMAMHKSDDLNNAVGVIFEELDKLNLGMLRCGIAIVDKEKRSADVFTTTKSEQGSIIQVSGDESMDIHPMLSGAFNAWANGKEAFSYDLYGDDLVQYYKSLGTTNFNLPEELHRISSNKAELQQYFFVATFSAGCLFAFRQTPFPDEAKKVMKRFANVFNLTYKRFLDIQQAEAQAREAQIEAALERVRARTMAMQRSDELPEAANLLFTQIQTLGIPVFSAGYN